LFGILTEDDKYVMMNNAYLASKRATHGQSGLYALFGFRENRWAIQHLVELFKHLYVEQFQDKDIHVKTVPTSILYSSIYYTTF
jgi:hypothetical protein